ncbi:MAG: biotin/lipoyl-binding protein [Acidobacteria bacterium]|nr:biotin/lipoyl-binding protein [Acidobacteriota bacterium]
MNDEFKELYVDGSNYKTKLTRKFGLRKIKPEIDDPKIVKAFIPGLIKTVYVKEGESVRRGDKLLVLEAMKMENQILSATKGVVKKVYVEEGKVVVKGELLLEIE